MSKKRDSKLVQRKPRQNVIRSEQGHMRGENPRMVQSRSGQLRQTYLKDKSGSRGILMVKDLDRSKNSQKHVQYAIHHFFGFVIKSMDRQTDESVNFFASTNLRAGKTD